MPSERATQTHHPETRPIVGTDSEFWELVAAGFGIAAKFELRRTRERTGAGRAAAKAQGG